MSPLSNWRARLPGAGSAEGMRHRYLELLIAALTHTLYEPPDRAELPAYVREQYGEAFRSKGIRFALPTPQEERLDGRDRPLYAQTMIGVLRMRNLREIVERALAERVPGDLIEAGTWRGGAAILMRGVLEANRDRDRTVWVADSFRGLPEPDAERYPADATDLNYTAEQLAVSLEDVRANFARYGLLDERVRFVEGWFRDTLPGLRDHAWAVVRLDGDLYESTMDGLVNLYPGLSPGGYLVVDDYGFPNCREAIEDYRREHSITEEITEVDWAGAFWRKSGQPAE